MPTGTEPITIDAIRPRDWRALLGGARRLGEMLREMPKDLGGRPENRSHPVTGFSPPTYADLGIEKMQASRWQTIASLPAPTFEQHITQVMTDGEELTTAGVIRLAKSLARITPEHRP